MNQNNTAEFETNQKTNQTDKSNVTMQATMQTKRLDVVAVVVVSSRGEEGARRTKTKRAAMILNVNSINQQTMSKYCTHHSVLFVYSAALKCWQNLQHFQAAEYPDAT